VRATITIRGDTTNSVDLGRRDAAVRRATGMALWMVAAVCLGGCSLLPSAGPSRYRVARITGVAQKPKIQIVDVDAKVAATLAAQHSVRPFSEALATSPADTLLIGPGDVLEVSIWEAPPATLFGVASAAAEARGGISVSRPATIPDEMVDGDGTITIPFAGAVRVAGKSLTAAQEEIRQHLVGKAHGPEVVVRLVHNASRNVTVVGDVNHSLRVPLTPSHERLLDALAAAEGVRQPVNKVMIQVTRGAAVQAMPLESIIRDPRQNVPLEPGDVVTALFEPLSFIALGASGKSAEINFEAQGITLGQALARAGGLVDAQSDPRGLFVFRFERPDALPWSDPGATATPDGQVPVVYRFNLADPESFFTIQRFPVSNRDVLYVSTAPVTDLQKFLNLVFSVVYPISYAKTALHF
jgi:polysaccharide export outer membrane protein